jgi:hypothetical protein
MASSVSDNTLVSKNSPFIFPLTFLQVPLSGKENITQRRIVYREAPVRRLRFASRSLTTFLLLQNAEDKWRPKIMINFVLLRSPLATLHDPEVIIVRRKR